MRQRPPSRSLLPALLLLAGRSRSVSARAKVGFHDDLEKTVRSFPYWHAAETASGDLTKKTFRPPKNYLIDDETAKRASPPDVLTRKPAKQSRSLQCPPEYERDEITAEAKSYDRRAMDSIRLNLPLHYQSKWRYFTLREWVYYAQCMTAHFASEFKPGQTVFDSGSGAGAFLKALDAVYPGMEMFGTDLSAAQVDFANGHVFNDAFCVANSRHIHWVRDRFPDGFDHVISNGVIHLACQDREEAFQFVQLMVDLARPGGLVWLGTINDDDKRQDPKSEMCYQWDGGSGGLFFQQSWWAQNLDAWGVRDLQIVHESDACGALYEGDRCRYTVLMRKKGGPMPPPRARRDEAVEAHLWRQRQLRKVDRVVELLEEGGGGGKGSGCSCDLTTNRLLGAIIILLGVLVIQRSELWIRVRQSKGASASVAKCA